MEGRSCVLKEKRGLLFIGAKEDENPTSNRCGIANLSKKATCPFFFDGEIKELFDKEAALGFCRNKNWKEEIEGRHKLCLKSDKVYDKPVSISFNF